MRLASRIMIVLLVTCGLARAGLEGTWSGKINGNPVVLKIAASGRIWVNQMEGTWMTDGDTLTMDVGDQVMIYRFSISGGTLTLENQTMVETLVFTRSGESRSKQRMQAKTESLEQAEESAFWVIRLVGKNRAAWCSVTWPRGTLTTLEVFDTDGWIAEPARSRSGRDVVFVVKHATHPRLFGRIGGQPFEMNLPANQDIQVRHPSLSRNGRLLAFTLRSAKHVGDVNLHDWNTGAYDSTFMAVGSWFKVCSIDLETGRQQAVYHDDARVPDVMKKRGLGPVFSPTRDELVYADSHRIYVCDAFSGRNLRTFVTPYISSGGWTGRALVSECSGLAFSPDGREIAYLSQGEADLAISPSWIVFFDIRNGNSRFITLPGNQSAGTPYGQICLDFSPDGRFLATSVTDQDPNRPVLCVVDTTSGHCRFLPQLGPCSQVVWKGR